jgi:hypothetical protein
LSRGKKEKFCEGKFEAIRGVPNEIAIPCLLVPLPIRPRSHQGNEKWGFLPRITWMNPIIEAIDAEDRL